MNETKVKELWKILENKYTWLGGLAKKVSMTRSVENQLHLKKKKSLSFTAKVPLCLSTWIIITKLLANLQILDVDLVINYDNTLLLLNSVPNTYNHLISTLLYKNDSIKFDIVSNARLCSESKVVTIIKLVKISVSFVITRGIKRNTVLIYKK